LGRIDLQVKIRGFRVEISEIETVIINACDEVKNTVVNVWKSQNTSSNEEQVEILVAYLLLKDGERFNEANAKFQLSQRLPHYMVPTIYQEIQEIPVLPSGKVNRKALPDPVITPCKFYIINYRLHLNHVTKWLSKMMMTFTLQIVN
jgi:acyl-CoA synthetase (AMP-forming)/AMP-acid ligase II